MEKRTFGSKNQILADVNNYKALSVVVGNTGVTATNEQGKKYIPAGTPIGGSGIDPFEDEQAVCVVSNDAEAKGVLLHDVVFGVGDAEANGTMLYFGTVNEFRIPDVTVDDAAKTALDGKVFFVKRNK